MLTIRERSREETEKCLKEIGDREYSRASWSHEDFITRFRIFAGLEVWNIVQAAKHLHGFTADEVAKLAEYQQAIDACYSAIANSDLIDKDTVLRGLRAALDIGSRTRPKPGQIKKEMRRSQSKLANSAKSERREMLKRAILQCVKENDLVLAASEKFALRIHGDVCKLLGIDNAQGSWPRPSVIKVAISEIKRGRNLGC